MAATKDWKKFERDILDRLDIRAEYEAFGIQFVGEESAKGWTNCRAIGRDDKNPSAGVFTGAGASRGLYKDFGGNLDCISLFNFAAKYGGMRTWADARRHYAKQVGLAKKLPKDDQEDRPIEKIEWIENWKPLSVRGLCKRYGVTEEILQLLGGKLGNYPANSPSSRLSVVFPAYGKMALEGEATGFVLQAADGGDLQIYKGPDSPPEPRKRMNLGQSGLVGRHGVSILESEELELVFKVEGISDLMALQSAIPPAERGKYAIVTNAAGAGETGLPSEVSHLFAGKHVVIIHDADTPGQNGAHTWLKALGGSAESVRNLKLPFPVAADHGKDLRDWLQEGNTFAELLTILSDPDNWEKLSDGSADKNQVSGLTRHQSVLARLNITVFGHEKDSSVIVGFSKHTKKWFRIRNIDKYKLENAIFDFGEQIEQEIDTDTQNPDPNKITMGAIRRAIASEGGKHAISDRHKIGVGAWEVGGRIVLVSGDELVICNGGLKRSEEPKIDQKFVDFSNEENWFDFDELKELMESSADPVWCQSVVDEAVALFSRWDNWKESDTPELVTALVLCSWLQTVWPWRPQVSIIGATASGKSMLVEETLQYLFGSLVIFCQKPTEAGLRQFIGTTAKVLIIDEFEHDQNRQKILELFRTSSRGGEIVRGTASQKGVKFGLRHIPWVSAIETGMRRAADRNRYIVMELGEVDMSKPGRVLLTTPPPEVLRKLGLRMLAVAIRYWRQALTLSEVLRNAKFDGVNQRIIESYSVPLGMLAAVRGMDGPAALILMAETFALRDFSQQNESDHEELLCDIYGSEVFLAKGQKSTVSILLGSMNHQFEEGVEDALCRIGIRRVRSQGAECLFFDTSAIRRSLLKDSRFRELEIDQILCRMKGAKRSKQKMGTHSSRGILVPEGVIDELINRPDRDSGEDEGGVGVGGKMAKGGDGGIF